MAKCAVAAAPTFFSRVQNLEAPGLVFQRAREIALEPVELADASPCLRHPCQVAPGFGQRQALAPGVDGRRVVAQLLVHHRDGLERARLPELVPRPLQDRDGLRVAVEGPREFGLHVEGVAEAVQDARHARVLVQLLEHLVGLLISFGGLGESALHVREVGQVGVAPGHLAAISEGGERLPGGGKRLAGLREAARQHPQRTGLYQPAPFGIQVPERPGEPDLEAERVEDRVVALLLLEPSGLGDQPR